MLPKVKLQRFGTAVASRVRARENTSGGTYVQCYSKSIETSISEQR